MIKGRWFTTRDGKIYAGDENGKFPYITYTETRQNVDEATSRDAPVIRILFDLLIDKAMQESYKVENKQLINLRGEVLDFCEYKTYREGSENMTGYASFEMVAVFGGFTE